MKAEESEFVSLVGKAQSTLSECFNNLEQQKADIPYKLTVMKSLKQFAEETTFSNTQPMNVLGFAIRNLGVQFFNEDVQRFKNSDGDQYTSKLQILIDAAFECVRAGLVESSIPVSVIEDCVQVADIKQCAELWNILENHRDDFTSELYETHGKPSIPKLILLRIANDLLRRISQIQATAFSGRIMMFLAYILPLSERSGVNVTGSFNSDVAEAYHQDWMTEDDTSSPNQTDYQEDTAEGDDINMNGSAIDLESSRSSTANDRLYQTFWNLQRYLANPPIAVANKENWEKFIQDLQTVMNALSQVVDSGEKYEIHSTQENEEAELTRNVVQYLTSKKLFQLQLRDSILQRHCLVQMLIAIRFLYMPLVKGGEPTFPDGVEPQSILPPIEAKIIETLRATPPDGTQFVSAILAILEREKYWAKWKAEGCASFEKPISKENKVTIDTAAQTAPEKNNKDATQASGLLGADIELPHPIPAFEWASHVMQNDFVDVCVDKSREVRPALRKHVSVIENALDPNNPFGDPSEVDMLARDKTFLWRGTRLLAHENLSALEKMPNKTFIDISKAMFGFGTTVTANNTSNVESTTNTADASQTPSTTDKGETSSEMTGTSTATPTALETATDSGATPTALETVTATSTAATDTASTKSAANPENTASIQKEEAENLGNTDTDNAVTNTNSTLEKSTTVEDIPEEKKTSRKHTKSKKRTRKESETEEPDETPKETEEDSAAAAKRIRKANKASKKHSKTSTKKQTANQDEQDKVSTETEEKE